jgi:chromosome segregation ATPase
VPPEETSETIADLMAERKRLEQILLETRASLTEREQFLSESEARLMKVSQTQLEREVDLEQREEQLRDLEKRLREMQTRLATERAPTPAPEKKPWDEFRE